MNVQYRHFNNPTVNGMDSTYRGVQRKKYWVRPKKSYTGDTIPLIEAVRSEMASLPTKTPVSVLQELLSRRGATPKYELVQIEGAIHEPTFRYRVTVADVVALGVGRSKKEAKHAAAKNILEKLVGNPPTEEISRTTTQPTSMNLNAMPTSMNLNAMPTSMNLNTMPTTLDKISGNPIGTLQEMCISRRWPPPTYEMTREEGLPHERQFTITCVVSNYREIGTGKSKKLAKRQAAYKMWEKLRESPIESSQMPYNDDTDTVVSFPTHRYSDVKSSKISTLGTPHSQKVSTFHKSLKQSTGEKLNELQTLALNQYDEKYINFLQDLATEQRFEVTYVDIEEKSLSGHCQCLVQLSTLPVAVCYGYGSSPRQAQACAARNALEYLKIMTKK